MSPVPASAITIADGEITIDAEMRKGNVSSGAKTGINKDAGRTRVTFRYRTRAWTVVVEPDGTLVESVAPAAKASPAKADHLSLCDLVRRTAS